MWFFWQWYEIRITIFHCTYTPEEKGKKDVQHTINMHREFLANGIFTLSVEILDFMYYYLVYRYFFCLFYCYAYDGEGKWNLICVFLFVVCWGETLCLDDEMFGEPRANPWISKYKIDTSYIEIIFSCTENCNREKRENRLKWNYIQMKWNASN